MDSVNVLSLLGAKVREVREERAWSIDDLANRSNVSAGMISQIERGMSNPTYLTLSKLAAGFGLPVAAFFDTSNQQSGRVVRKAQRRQVTFSGANIAYQLLTPDLQRKLEVIWVEMEAGSSTAEHVYTHEGEECGIVLAGRMIVHVGDEVHELLPGDAISYPSTIPHWYEAPGPEKVNCIWAITPPSF